MSSGLVDSQNYFNEYLLRIGMAEPVRSRLSTEGFRTLASPAYAIPTEDNSAFTIFAEHILGPDSSSGAQAVLRRAIHEAYALTLAQVKHTVEGHSDDHAPPKLPPAERETRRDSQKARLQGVEFTGVHEPSHKVLDRVNEFVERNELKYDPWCYYNSRDSEVRGARTADTVKIGDHGVLRLTKGRDGGDQEADIHDAYLARCALKRRAVAFDMHSLASFSVLESVVEHLFSRLYTPAPPGYQPPSLTRLAEADRELWRLVIEHCRTGLKADADGHLPIDKALNMFLHDARVAFYLLPVVSLKRKSEEDPAGARRRAAPKKSGTRGVTTSTPRMPLGLVGHRHTDVEGRRICFAFNLDGCTSQGSSCPRGHHSCAGCGSPGHALPQCNKVKSRGGK
eukprot:6470127-Amphidinium_carterae.1